MGAVTARREYQQGLRPLGPESGTHTRTHRSVVGVLAFLAVVTIVVRGVPDHGEVRVELHLGHRAVVELDLDLVGGTAIAHLRLERFALTGELKGGSNGAIALLAGRGPRRRRWPSWRPPPLPTAPQQAASAPGTIHHLFIFIVITS